MSVRAWAWLAIVFLVGLSQSSRGPLGLSYSSWAGSLHHKKNVTPDQCSGHHRAAGRYVGQPIITPTLADDPKVRSWRCWRSSFFCCRSLATQAIVQGVLREFPVSVRLVTAFVTGIVVTGWVCVHAGWLIHTATTFYGASVAMGTRRRHDRGDVRLVTRCAWPSTG
jgi:hypothetical protein